MNFAAKIRSIPDFPRDGIDYKDITTLLKDGKAFRMAIDCLAKIYKNERIDIIVSPESRGFMIGCALAYALEAGFVPARKAGRLPAPALRLEYSLEYGADILEIHKDAVTRGMRVLIVDDLLATGGTSSAVVKMAEQLGGEVAGLAFLIELAFLNGRKQFDGYKVSSLIVY